MSHLSFWILSCLIGLTSLQAADNSIAPLEARCRPEFIDQVLKDEPVPFEPIFAFIYNANAHEHVVFRTSGYRTTSPISFNSQGALKKITYNSVSGELIIPVRGNYEITYSVNAGNSSTKLMALAVNGKEVPKSEKPLIDSAIAIATLALPLAKGDRVSLILPGTSQPGLNYNAGDGNSAFLFIKKL
jgi:hypothetical protein